MAHCQCTPSRDPVQADQGVSSKARVKALPFDAVVLSGDVLCLALRCR